MRPATAKRRTRPRPLAAALATACAMAASTVMLTGCAAARDTPPGCGEPLRLALIAQSVPSAAYVPCLRQLPPGWRTSAFDAASGGTSFLLNSDRSPGRPVRVQLVPGCTTRGASPAQPRAAGVLTYIKLISVSPRYAGDLYDVFPGGCIRYSFDFQVGPSISLMQQFQSAVGLYSVQQLQIVLKKELGVDITP